ncbi:kinase-like domain-containing protein [Cyathus striatus]|nr:kinase-like domain-containing protein [Cyathus striatus]
MTGRCIGMHPIPLRCAQLLLGPFPSDRATDYTIGAPIGFGASSIVYTALYHPQTEHPSSALPPPIPCALKVLDLDSLPPRSLHLLQRETTLMSLSKHPNVLRVRGSWIEGHKLYIALRLMNKGSAADVMRYGWPGGMEEDVCLCILAQSLKGLNYLHVNGFIHRDVKAANLLIDDDGTVLLGDLGVAADLAEHPSHHLPSSRSSKTTAAAALSQVPHISSKQGPAVSKRSVAFGSSVPASRPQVGKRKSFVGTPCWMAPEIIQGKQYDSSADIWSFGITALELTQGRPPRSRESPQNVLLRTIQEEPPSLDREGGTFKYSRVFKEDLPPLTQRQERRITKNSQSLLSIDSWDFATTVRSPTASVYRNRVLDDTYSPAESSKLDDVETEQPTHKAHMERSEPMPSSPSDSQGSAGPSESPEEGKYFLSPPSPSTAPSSVPDSLHMASATIFRPPKTYLSQNSTTPPGDGSLSLWRKIKSNVRRPSSRGGPVDTSAEGKTGMGSKFAEAGKSMLSRTGSRTASAVGAFIQGRS